MSDWQVGDMAIAIRGKAVRKSKKGHSALGAPRVRIGGFYTVSGVIMWKGVVGLILRDRPSRHPTKAWHSAYFMKVTPPAADEFDREVIEQMNGAPVREPV